MNVYADFSGDPLGAIDYEFLIRRGRVSGGLLAYIPGTRSEFAIDNQHSVRFDFGHLTSSVAGKSQ
ncbi:MAG TPA: hypothetical protein VKH45_06315 [Candidatus Acidoferrum sp.]|nr:hypothetical protein [Candidatus Acidoferrum sp.]